MYKNYHIRLKIYCVATQAMYKFHVHKLRICGIRKPLYLCEKTNRPRYTFEGILSSLQLTCNCAKIYAMAMLSTAIYDLRFIVFYSS